MDFRNKFQVDLEDIIDINGTKKAIKLHCYRANIYYNVEFVGRFDKFIDRISKISWVFKRKETIKRLNSLLL